MSLKKQKPIIFSVAETGDIDGLEDLISNGSFRQECIDVINDYKDDDGNNVLLVAARGGHEGMVLRLLELGATIDLKNNQGQTALQIACEKGYQKVLQILLDKNADIYSVDYEGNTLLHSAGQRDSDKVIEMLLDRGASKLINLMNKNGDTALQNAFYLGNEKSAQLLLERGADIELVKKVGNTALHMACSWGNDKIVNMLLQCGASNNINRPNAKEQTALHIACERGHVNIVRALLENGADICRLDKIGNTAFHTACQWSNDKVVEVLLKKDKSSSEPNNDGATSLQVASEGNHTRAMRGLMDCVDKTGNTILHYACGCDLFQVVKMILDRGAKQLINKPNFSKETPLHVACDKGCVEIVEALIDAGADMSCVDEEDNTVLHKACKVGNDELALILLRSGGGKIINTFNKQKRTALLYACRKGLSEVVWCLLEWGADMNLVDATGDTILHKICIYGDIKWEIVEILLDRASRQCITKFNGSGKTALHIACEDNSVRIVKMMLERGVDVDYCDRNGNTLLHSACKGGSYELVEMLLSRGANKFIAMTNKDGFTAVQFACEENHVRVVKILIENGAVYTDNNRNTILHTASSLSRFEFAKTVLDLCPTLINKKNLQEKTALHLACQNGNTNVVELLIERGADMDCVDEEGHTILHQACWAHNDFLLVFMLLGKGGSKHINKQSKSGETAFHIVYLKHSVQTMKMLLERGADVDCVDCSSGDTILHKACRKGETEIVKMLFDYGANVELLNNEGEKAIHIISKMDIIEIFLTKFPNMVNSLDSKGFTLLHKASRYLNYKLVKYLLKMGANVNCATKSCGSTPLHLALKTPHPSRVVVESLINIGASVNIKDKDDDTPLHLAARNALWANSKVLKIMLLKGIHLHTKNKKNQTPYNIFCENENLKSFVNNCLLELTKIKSFRIVDSFTLQTVFSKDQNPLYLRNNEVLGSFDQFIQSRSVVLEFPLYFDLLQTTYAKSKCRLEYLKIVHQLLSNIIIKNQRWDKLPSEVKDHVLAFLTYEELEWLVYVFKNWKR